MNDRTPPTAEWTYKMLQNESLWHVARQVHDLLAARSIPHAIVGGVAVCLHGYRRNTVDLDLLVRPEDVDGIRAAMTEQGFIWSPEAREFRTPNDIPVQFLMAGEKAGPQQEATLPDPADRQHVSEIEGLPVLRLSQLVQAKLACGQGNLRRTHRDFADVVELIQVRGLNASFARFLHKSVRKTFRELVRRVQA